MADPCAYLWEVIVSWQKMDMSGGDVVDGPRWTGGHIPVESTLFIVAGSEDLAKAAAANLFYGHQKAKAISATNKHPIAAIVTLTR
jgi:hypothetical protein